MIQELEPDADGAAAGQPVRQLRDARSLRALTHPVRLALLDALAAHPTLTATQAGLIIGDSPTTCSFHFRQLSKYGFVEQAGRGPGRERPWRLTQSGVHIDPSTGGPGLATSARSVESALLEHHLAHLRGWHETRDLWPAAWLGVTDQSQFLLWVTPDELVGVVRDYVEVLGRYRGRIGDPASRPADAVLVGVLTFAYPRSPRPSGGGHL